MSELSAVRYDEWSGGLAIFGDGLIVIVGVGVTVELRSSSMAVSGIVALTFQ